ncbi:hypothetical protein J6590_021718 [Homalodisca vitripennis]|nr:hypothetical protein J6590_021718 [Homalodisca vitripennis]
MIVLGGYNIYMQPTPGNSPAQVTVNGQQTPVSKSYLTELFDQNGNTLAQMYARPNGEVHFYAAQQDIKVQYDGTAVKVKAQNSYRSETRGLCGTFNTQPVDDFTTPQGYILQNPYEFAATYALESSSCQGPAKELKARAQQQIAGGHYSRNVVIYGNVVTDADAYHYSRSNSNKYGRLRILNKEKYVSCSQRRLMTMQKDGKQCFSVQPQLLCTDQCSPQGYVNKEVQFMCVLPSSVSEHWKKLVNRGINPDFSDKHAYFQTYNVQVPQSCQAN